MQWQDKSERFESLVFDKDQTQAQHQQNRYLVTTLIKMFVINLLLNKILCAAFGTLPSGPPPSYPSMSHLNYVKNLGSGLDPLPPFGTMSHISGFFFKVSLNVYLHFFSQRKSDVSTEIYNLNMIVQNFENHII